MKKEKLALRLKGVATFKWIENGEVSKVEIIPNAIQAGAKDIVAKNLIAKPEAVIDTIALYLAGNLVKSNPITDKSVVSTAEVMFSALFAPADFTGNFDEARLIASGTGNFSIITAIVASKDNTQSLLITWNIQIV